MENFFGSDPKITYALIKLEDLLQLQIVAPHPDYELISKSKSRVLTHYQPIFSASHIPSLTKAEFHSFLLIKNNGHWDSLHRVGKYMTEDMELLREALMILVDERQPIQNRLNELRPERYWGEHSMVSHLGMPVLTAILQIFQPSKYGVWNNTSDFGLRRVKLWNQKWETQNTGETYLEMNNIYLYLAKKLDIDLWTLDVLWWVLKKST
ncbi:MAG TPA: hypothetical protein VN364_11065 [Bellilinea sp.]|nr:hypothetical protein [Bellilinea sp.]